MTGRTIYNSPLIRWHVIKKIRAGRDELANAIFNDQGGYVLNESGGYVLNG